MTKMHGDLEIYGYWSLESWNKCYSGGERHPINSNGVQGFLHYGSDGVMAVSIYDAKSLHVLTTYTGPFEYLDGIVVHYPVVGQSPQGILDKKLRYIKLDQGGLLMRTKPFEDYSDGFSHELLWRKLMS